MERNRYAVMLMFFKLPTCIVLFPMWFVLEIGLWIFAFKKGYVSKRFDVYKYWLEKDNRAIWLSKRKKIQTERMISDRQLLKYTVSGIYFQEQDTRNPLLVYVGNPLMKMYYWVIVKVLIWW